MFSRIDENGQIFRNRVTLSCEGDVVRVEQSHKKEVDINNIIRKHGLDMIAKTNQLMKPEFYMDDIPTNDFMEAMSILAKAETSFQQLPSEIRKKFDYNPAQFMDFIHNPENKDAMYDLGLAVKEPQEPVVQVEVVNQTTETPHST